MKELSTTLRYLAREDRTARWLRSNLLLLLLLSITLLVLIYSASHLAMVEDNIGQYRAYLSAHLKQAEARQSYQRDSEKVASILKSMGQRYRQPGMVQRIERLAQSSGVTVDSQQYRTGPGRGKNQSWQIDISAQGDYAGLKGFVHKLSSLRGVAVEEKLKLTQGQGTERLKLQLLISVFQLQP